MKKKISRARKLEIKNPSKRDEIEKGFDDMAGIAIGNEDHSNDSADRELSSDDEISSEDFLNTIREEDRKHKKNKIILWTSVILAVVIAIVGGILYERHIEATDGTIKVTYASSDLEGKDYHEVVSELEDDGFTNITTEPVDDLITGWINKDGEVETVEIDGDTKFSNGSRYLPDSKIVVTYHTFPEEICFRTTQSWS